MPFKTQYGTHYHMTEGCHGATIPCDTAGLEPCSDCCEGSSHSDEITVSGVGSGAGSVDGTYAMDDSSVERSEGTVKSAGSDWYMLDIDEDGTEIVSAMSKAIPLNAIITPEFLATPEGVEVVNACPNCDVAAEELLSGPNQLVDGLTKLVEGAIELVDGMTELVQLGVKALREQAEETKGRSTPKRTTQRRRTSRPSSSRATRRPRRRSKSLLDNHNVKDLIPSTEWFTKKIAQFSHLISSLFDGARTMKEKVEKIKERAAEKAKRASEVAKGFGVKEGVGGWAVGKVLDNINNIPKAAGAAVGMAATVAAAAPVAANVIGVAGRTIFAL